MAVTEKSRHQMLRTFTETVGEEAAMTLAEHLPPVGWADGAAKADLHALEERLEERRGAIDARFERIDLRFEETTTLLRGETRSGDTELRNEMHAGFAELRSEMQVGFAELRSEMHVAFAELSTQLHRTLVRFTLAMVALIIAAIPGTVGLVTLLAPL